LTLSHNDSIFELEQLTERNIMTAQIPAFPLRMPSDLRAWFEAAAEENGRSLNSEIVQLLKEVKARAVAAQAQKGNSIE
jgi:hypothetical protein